MTIKALQDELDKEKAILKLARNRLANQTTELEALKARVDELTARDNGGTPDAGAIFLKLVENLDNGILAIDEHKNIVSINRAFCKLFRVLGDPEAMIGKGVSTVIGHVERQLSKGAHFIANIEKLYRNESNIPTIELTTVSGTFCTCQYITISPDSIYKGGILKFVDVTRTKTISDTFDTQRNFYEQILNNSPADIVVFSPDHRFMYVNPIAVENDELRSWMIGKTNEEYSIYTNIKMQVYETRKNVFEKVISTKTKNEFEEKIPGVDGEPADYLRIYYPVLDSKGEVEIVVGYGVDITARKKVAERIKESEEKYRGIIEKMNLGMIEIDANEQIVYANSSFCRMSEYSLDELVTQRATDLFLKGANLKRTRAQLSKRKYEITNSYEIVVKTKSGEDRWWLTSATPLFDDDDNQVGAISIHLDITEQKKLEEQLKSAKQETERSSKSKDIFLTNMSHEIRTPLNAIMGLGKLLSKSDLSKQQKDYLNGIESASVILLGIINDLLDFSKIEAGKITIEKISFNLENILKQSTSVLEYKAEEKGLKLTYDIDHRIAPVLIGDPYRLNQVFMNMISNAIKFTEKGSVWINACLLSESDGEQKVLVVIEDTGVGIKEDYLKKIFDKFTQEDETVVRKFGGTGLGMSITKQLIELMDGEISIQSEKNVGTTVSLIFSCKVGTARVFEKKRTIKNDTYNINGKRILLVEDNNLNRLLAYTILADYGAEIIEAENGEIAVSLLRDSKFDIVLMDIQMPVMDGIRATKIIRKEIDANIPILALTANVIKSHEKQFFDAGMNDLISKPYNEINLVRPIAKWLNHNIKEVQSVATPPELAKEVTPSEPLYDLGMLLGIGKDDPGFIIKMLQLFINETPPLVEKMKEALKEGDFDSIRYYGHRMKPSITNLGILTLKPVILKIELIKDNDPEINMLISNLDKVLKVVIAKLSEEMKSRQSAV